MPCPHHQGFCAYPEPSDELCSFCHASWEKITAPETRITTRTVISRSGKRTVVEDVHYTGGYGELPLNHFWRHALTTMRAEASTARKAAIRKAVA